MKFTPLLHCVLAIALIFSHATSQLGFTSIDCGLPLESTNYTDAESGIIYSTDLNSYIDRGVNSSVNPKFIENFVDRHLQTVRYFPPEQGNRSCYDLTSLQAANKRYLIRATFKYGNYDGRNQPPRFDLYLGVEFWDTVELNDSTSVLTREIIHVPLSNYLYVCLVHTGAGTPFISALELRLLKGDAYKTQNAGESLASFRRWNFAPADPSRVYRYPDDNYDRLWQPYPSPDDWIPLNTTLTVVGDNDYAPPETVMQSAVTPRNPNNSLRFSWIPPNPELEFYVYFYFAEFEKLRSGEYRGMYINLNDIRWMNEAVFLTYLYANTVFSSRGNARSSFNFSLVKTENSTHPPLINAFEVYMVKQLLLSQTDENDVAAILSIKSAYGVKRDWQGDPCLPQNFTWHGLVCITSNNDIPPRIKSLNLSSDGLNGTVSTYFSKFSSLESLDLSNNKLIGSIPDFLADLPQLKFLNLSGNNFTGPIPPKLLDKAKSGLQLRFDGFMTFVHLENGFILTLQTDECKSSNKSNTIVILMAVALAVSILVVLAALIFIWRFRRIKPEAKVVKLGSISRRREFLVTKKKKFTYSDIVEMTNNFQRILGKGGFGTVYHGTVADGKEVAVKLLSQASTQGYNEFQTEAELLTRVHHCKLTNMVGYCYEDAHMALVYEYMAGGNLREHISGDGNALSWSERLHILLDAAQGLDYLHNGCKPPIIHRDIKSTNILLTENLEAKLADFGLSRAFTVDDGSYVSTRVVGTPGYLDPEYYETQRLHEKSDIYSFGVVILELITGRPVIFGDDKNRGHIAHWVSYLVKTGDVASIVDPKLEGNYDLNTVWKALEIAMACTSPTSLARPNTAHVLSELKDCLEAERAHSQGHETDDVSYLFEANPSILEIEAR